MTYNVFGGTLSLTQSINQSTDCRLLILAVDDLIVTVYASDLPVRTN